MPKKVELSNPGDLVERYRSGGSVNQLAKEFVISRSTAMRILREHGVEPRGRSDAERLKWSRRDRVDVERQLRNAWRASRGRIVSHETKLKAARTRFERLSRVGRYEHDIAIALRARGQFVEQQTPVGSYNLDLSLEVFRLAVEIVSTSPGRKGWARLRERTEYVLDRGWLLVFVDLRRGAPNIDAVADKLISLAHLSCRDESARGQYGVIGREGDATPFGRKLHGLPRIECA